MVCTHYGDQVTPSWVRWFSPVSLALCPCPGGACESPRVPVEASLSWCDLRVSPCALVPRKSRYCGKAGVVFFSTLSFHASSTGSRSLLEMPPV